MQHLYSHWECVPSEYTMKFDGPGREYGKPVGSHERHINIAGASQRYGAQDLNGDIECEGLRRRAGKIDTIKTMEDGLLKGKIRLLLGLVFVTLILFLAIISFTGVSSDQTWSTSEKKIDGAEKLWNRRGTSSYRIRVRVTGFWDQQEYSIAVQDGEVVDFSSTCVPDGPGEPCCTACFEPEDYTVPGLFSNARAMAAASRISFDAQYGFPSIIAYDVPEMNDEEQEWKVLEFHPGSP